MTDDHAASFPTLKSFRCNHHHLKDIFLSITTLSSSTLKTDQTKKHFFLTRKKLEFCVTHLSRTCVGVCSWTGEFPGGPEFVRAKHARSPAEKDRGGEGGVGRVLLINRGPTFCHHRLVRPGPSKQVETTQTSRNNPGASEKAAVDLHAFTSWKSFLFLWKSSFTYQKENNQILTDQETSIFNNFLSMEVNRDLSCCLNKGSTKDTGRFHRLLATVMREYWENSRLIMEDGVLSDIVLSLVCLVWTREHGALFKIHIRKWSSACNW